REVAAYLVRVNPRRDEDDGLGVFQRRGRVLRGLEPARVGETGVQLPVVIEAPEVLRAGNHQGDEWGAERGAPELPVPHAITGAGERLIVPDQRRPVGELPLVAGLEPEDRSRSRDALGGGA